MSHHHQVGWTVLVIDNLTKTFGSTIRSVLLGGQIGMIVREAIASGGRATATGHRVAPRVQP